MPSARNARSVTSPMPGILRTGSGARNCASCPAGIHSSPLGLAWSLATFATKRVDASPAEQGSDVSAVIMRSQERRAMQFPGAGKVQVRFINRNHLDDGRKLCQDRGHPVAALGVFFM